MHDARMTWLPLSLRITCFMPAFLVQGLLFLGTMLVTAVDTRGEATCHCCAYFSACGDTTICADLYFIKRIMLQEETFCISYPTCTLLA